MKKILIVDDNFGVRSTLTKFLQAKQYCIDDASSGKIAIKKAVTNEYDVVILDQVMPEMTGTDVLIELKKISPQSKVIMMTGFGSIKDAIDSIKKGASEYVQKPFDFDELHTTIKRCLEEKQFNKSLKKYDIDFTLSTLSNPLRRSILKLIKSHDAIHLMKIAKELCVDDHTKIVFHMKNLISTGLINKDEKKGYHLTKEGHKAYDCLNIIERHLS
jgi:DNA-binding NtrC family response regulator